jgi:hypothetical protein
MQGWTTTELHVSGEQLLQDDANRTLIKLRQLLASNTELGRRFDELESKYDKQFKIVFDAIGQLWQSQLEIENRLGFVCDPDR